MLQIRKTNSLFDLIDDVDITGANCLYKGTFAGDVYIRTTDGLEKTFSGEHSAQDFSDDFGFEVVEAEFEFVAIDKYGNRETFPGKDHYEAQKYSESRGLIIFQSARL
jgi:hypothetical protein